MAYFPTYFPGTYFGEGYWRGITGGTSLEGGGTGQATGGATLFEEARGAQGGGFREYQRRVRQLLYITPRDDDPLPINGGGESVATGSAALTITAPAQGAGRGFAGGNAVMTMGHDFTEQDNAFWALAA